jgi:hypothetical protein
MLFSLLIALVVVGVALYLLQLIPMDATVKRIIQVLAILLIVLYVLNAIRPMLKL